MKTFNLLFTLCAITGFISAQQAFAADPTAVNVTVYKTEACTDSTTCVTILDNSSGVTADLVSGNGAFGSSPSVAAGTYKKLRLTLKNEISVTGDGDGSGTSCTSSTTPFLIDSSQSATAQVTIAFATADSSPAGATGWYANGSETNPLLMSDSITVQADGTTNVNVSFNTAGTLSCVAGVNTLAPPTFAVTSYVQPSTASSFTGGDYWLFTNHANPNYLAAASAIPTLSIDIDGDGTNDWPPVGDSYTAGQQIYPITFNGVPLYQALLNSADGPAYEAQIRAFTNRSIQWGGKVNFSAPDSTGAGTISVLRNPGELRIASVPGQDDYIAAATTDSAAVLRGTYQIDSHNKIIIQVDGSSPLRGAITKDSKTILVGGLEDGMGIITLLKVDPSMTGSSAIPSLGFWNEYSVSVYRDDTTNKDGENGNESIYMSFYNSVGVIDTTSVTGFLTLQNLGVNQQVSNPQNTPTSSPAFSTTAMNDDNWQQMATTSLGINLVDGADYLPIKSNSGVDTDWIVSNGSLTLIASAIKYSPRDTGINTTLTGNTTHDGSTYSGEDATQTYTYTHTTSFGFMTATAASGTFTQSALAGNYYLASMWDDTTGSTSSRFGATEADVTLNSDGTGSFVGRELNNLNQVSTDTGSFNWSIVSGCLGVNNNGTPADSSDDTRLSFGSTATCNAAGGHIIDVVRVIDPGTSKAVAVLLPEADGNLMSFVDPNSTDASNFERRQLGLAVKLQ